MVRDHLGQILPHYAVMLGLVFAVSIGVRILVGDPGLVVDVVVVFGIIFGYRPAVTRIDGVPTPDVWQQTEESDESA